MNLWETAMQSLCFRAARCLAAAAWRAGQARSSVLHRPDVGPVQQAKEDLQGG